MQEDKVVQYGVWSCGNEEEQPGLCYEGREVFLTKFAQEALRKKNELQKWFPDATYKLVKIMEVEDAE